MELTLTTTLTPEQALSLREGMRHRAAYYGWPVTREGEGEALTVALAWWCAWWRDRRRQADVRGADMETGELFAAPVCIGHTNTDDVRADGGAACDPGRGSSSVRPPFAATCRFYAAPHNAEIPGRAAGEGGREMKR